MEFTDPACDVPVLPTKALPLRSIADSTPAAASCAVGFAVETWSAALSAPGNLTISAKPADLPADCTPVPTPVEAHNTTHAMDPEPAVALHAICFPSNPVPAAARTLVHCQPNLDFSNVSSGSQGFLDLPTKISSNLSEELYPRPLCQPTSIIPSALLNSQSPTHMCCPHLMVGCSSSIHSARLVVRPAYAPHCRQMHCCWRSGKRSGRLALRGPWRSHHLH